MIRKIALGTLLLAAAAAGSVLALTPPRSAPSDAARRGQAFAEQRCAACHGVKANSPSPNPESPSFEDIANRPGVTAQTLHAFLRDSHNYPAAMNFTVEDAQLGDLAVYIETLRKPGYRPVM